MRGTTGVILEHQRILRLPRKMTLQHFKEISRKQLKRHFQCGADPSMIRAGSENDPSWIRAENRHPQPASQPRLLFRTTTSILYSKIQHFALRLSFQISPNTAPAKKSDTSTSPNTAPATQNDCHNWSSSHVKRYFQCAERPVSSWNISEYCACHAKWLSNISKKFLENSWNVISNAGPIRAWSSWIREWSELDPSWKPSSATRLATEVTFQDHHEHFVLKNTTFRAPAIIPNFTEYCMRLPRKVTLQLHRILRLPRKVTLERHQIVHVPRKVTLERHQIVHLPRKVTLELHQTVHLPRKVTLRYSTLL